MLMQQRRPPEFTRIHSSEVAVRWMINNYTCRTNCILGDEMGLGKTAQVWGGVGKTAQVWGGVGKTVQVWGGVIL